MKNKDQHPDRPEMLQAIESGEVSFESHLAQCKSCRQTFELLMIFSGAGNPPLHQSSSEAIGRHVAIGRQEETRYPSRTIFGELITDSWSQLAVAQLRDATVGLERRLTLRANAVSLELVAERIEDKWQFVARVYKEDAVTTEFVLKVAGRNLAPQTEGFYHWSSVRPPRTLRLLSKSLKIDFENVSWLSPAID